MAAPVIENVADTALMVAAFRERETLRPDALIQDPLAGILAGDRGRAMLTSVSRYPLMAWNVVMRTLIIDRMIREAVAGGVDTVLNLGAGLDTRPYRMDLPPGLRFVEVDREHLLAMKESALKKERPRCTVDRMAADITDPTVLAGLLARLGGTSKSMLVLTEGVVPYLTNDEAGTLADALRQSTAVRHWIVDYLSPQTLRWRVREARRGKSLQNALFRFDPGDWLAFFAARGWAVGELAFLADEGDKAGRAPPFPKGLLVLMALRGLWRSKERSSAMRRFAGYARLEPTALRGHST